MSHTILCKAQWVDRSLKAYDRAAPLRLVSVHQHVANLAVEGWRHLLMIVDPTLPRGPASVGLSLDGYSQFLSFAQRCTEGRYSNGLVRLISLNQELIIDWASAPRHSSNPPLFSPADGKQIAAASSCYRQWLLEMDRKVSASSVLFNIEGDDDYFRCQIQTYFPPLIQALLSGNNSTFTTYAVNLVGLGRGSTPTGDDLIYGALMAWHYSRSMQKSLSRTVLTDDILSKTTLLSRHMLEMARLGLAPETVQKFLLSVYTGQPDYTILEEICQMGATTGYDICVGALAFINGLSST